MIAIKALDSAIVWAQLKSNQPLKEVVRHLINRIKRPRPIYVTEWTGSIVDKKKPDCIKMVFIHSHLVARFEECRSSQSSP